MFTSNTHPHYTLNKQPCADATTCDYLCAIEKWNYCSNTIESDEHAFMHSPNSAGLYGRKLQSQGCIDGMDGQTAILLTIFECTVIGTTNMYISHDECILSMLPPLCETILCVSSK